MMIHEWASGALPAIGSAAASDPAEQLRLTAGRPPSSPDR
jgi:hypothetical protein